MADREDFLNSLTGDAPAGDTPTDPAPQDDTPIMPAVETPADTPSDAPAEPTDKPEAEAVAPSEGKTVAALLDELSGDAPKPDAEAPKVEAKPAAEKPADAPASDKTLDEQEAEALEGVKSERGQARIKETFARLRETEQRAQQFETDINEFRTMVQSTGMKPEEFAQTLEFGRLVNSGDEADLRVALEMVDAQREQLCKRLGIEAPGVDPLADFPDLKSDVDNMAITKERALEVAKFRRQQQAQQQAQQNQQAQQQEAQQWQQKIATVTKTAESYFATRAKEADYPAKMQQIAAKFKEPAFMQDFVATYQPEQWFSIMRMMYDSIAVAPAAPVAHQQQPIRTRPSHAGQPVTNANASTADKLLGILDNMGV